jgi:hypothetical protein
MTKPDDTDRGWLAAPDAVWRDWLARQVPAAYNPDDGRLLEHIGGEWWRVVGEERLLDADAVRALVSDGWTLTGALAVALYGGRYEQDDGEITPEQLAKIQALVRDRHGNAVLLRSSLFDHRDDEEDTRPNLLDCSDEQLERTRRAAAEFSDRQWPALAALAHELPDDERPSASSAIWISVRAPGPMPPVPDIGKWCIVRPAAEIDAAWELVRAAVMIGKVWAAKVSGASQAIWHGGTHLICVYCPDSQDLAEVRRVRGVLRELGFTEELGYKTDRATRSGVRGDAEWMLRE